MSKAQKNSVSNERLSDAVDGKATGINGVRHSKLLLGFLGVGLVCMLGASFLFALQDAELVIHRTPVMQSHTPNAPHSEGGTNATTAENSPAAMGNAMDEAAAEQLSALMAAMQKAPNDPAALRNLGEYFLEHDDFARAAVFLDKSAKADASSPAPLYSLGMAYFHLEEHGKAAAAFETLVALVPDPMAHYNLGILYKHFLNDPQKGTAHFTKVLGMQEADEALRKHATDELNSAHEHE